MNNSVATTGGISVSAAAIAPAVTWALTGFHRPVPDSVPLLIAAGLITAAHALHNLAVIKGWYPIDDVSPKKEPAALDAVQP